MTRAATARGAGSGAYQEGAAALTLEEGWAPVFSTRRPVRLSRICGRGGAWVPVRRLGGGDSTLQRVCNYPNGQTLRFHVVQPHLSEHITKGLVVSFLAPLTPAAPPSSWARWPRPLETSSSRLLAVSR